ncbi:MAG: preprotein translocase subunit SecE [Candidatus Melainabacteria bacterium]|nr:preprotein translocase subunit SecE [Candidatus Melainabacteria bacterium]
MAIAMSEKETDNGKVEIETKPFNLKQFLSEVKSEFLKITWPSREQTTTEFFSVMLLVAIITGIIFAMDKVFKLVADFFTGRLF